MRRGATSSALGGALAVAFSLPGLGAAAPAIQTGYIRTSQVGYEVGETARAFLITPQPATGATFRVKDRAGQVVLRGSVGAPAGPWGAFAVTPLALTGLGVGRYEVSVLDVDAQPGRLVIDTPEALYAAPMANALAFYQTERDGPDYVPSALRTAPGHLNDKAAAVFQTPAAAGGTPATI
jgi:endoglucanase